MKITMACVLLAGLLLSGCTPGLAAYYWSPSFENKTASGSGSDTVDITKDFGVELDTPVLAYELITQQGAQRMRITYWMIEGSGTSTIGATPVNFANHTYNPGDLTSTTMDFTNIGLIYEPAIIRTNKWAFRIAIGINAVNFNMVADDITTPPAPGDGETHVPSDTSDFEAIGYMPVPVGGACLDITFNDWLALTVRGQYFDTALVGLEDQVDAHFMGGDAGLLIGKPAGHIMGFAGYRYYHVEYVADTDTGDSTLDGITGGIVVSF